MIDDATKTRIAKIIPLLAESQRRIFLGIEAMALA